eukprot:gnl/MRDRNA2_/MRDRNA2_69216_c0_seq1.p1 gnl/MRDRNA2_/MRDRNA2_69216_c0~~gnl/MRDRNA2_/MRDRNA2_69216_c0_seq1.p1  ORF type:complete len:897 (-),score=209.82 gnl/MRDRNA2_/MRDRNA2_69216_c0_seq1:1818-4382(-)
MPGQKTVYEEYKQRITQIYQQCNPTKLNQIPILLQKYAGKEHQLYQEICNKYNVSAQLEYTLGGVPKKFPPPNPFRDDRSLSDEAGSGAVPPGGGLFGAATTKTAPVGGCLFGATASGAATAPAAGGIFGAAVSGTAPAVASGAAPASGGLFGKAAASAASTGGGIFSTVSTGAVTTPGLFGTVGSIFAAASSGAAPAPAAGSSTPAGGIFGAASSSTLPSCGGLFGAPATSTAPVRGTGGSIFGAASSGAAPAAGNPFGIPASTASAAWQSIAAPVSGGLTERLFGAESSSDLEVKNPFRSNQNPFGHGLFGASGSTATPAIDPESRLRYAWDYHRCCKKSFEEQRFEDYTQGVGRASATATVGGGLFGAAPSAQASDGARVFGEAAASVSSSDGEDFGAAPKDLESFLPGERQGTGEISMVLGLFDPVVVNFHSMMQFHKFKFNFDKVESVHEECMFRQRSKLSRFTGSDWKESGAGEAKLLKHKHTGRIRFIVSQYHTGKILANHYVISLRTPTLCNLAPNAGSDKCWVWTANDYADGEAVKEQFALKFETAELAQKFKEAFEKAKTTNMKMMDPSSSERPSCPIVSTVRRQLWLSVLHDRLNMAEGSLLHLCRHYKGIVRARTEYTDPLHWALPLLQHSKQILAMCTNQVTELVTPSGEVEAAAKVFYAMQERVRLEQVTTATDAESSVDPDSLEAQYAESWHSLPAIAARNVARTDLHRALEAACSSSEPLEAFIQNAILLFQEGDELFQRVPSEFTISRQEISIMKNGREDQKIIAPYVDKIEDAVRATTCQEQNVRKSLEGATDTAHCAALCPVVASRLQSFACLGADEAVLGTACSEGQGGPCGND